MNHKDNKAQQRAFKAEELALRYEITSWFGPDFVDKFILFIGLYSSFFGQNLLRAVGCLAIANLIFYVILVWCYDIQYLNVIQGDSFSFIGDYFALLDPFGTKSYNVAGLGPAILFLSKLTTAFFTYHIVISSRKFMR